MWSFDCLVYQPLRREAPAHSKPAPQGSRNQDSATVTVLTSVYCCKPVLAKFAADSGLFEAAERRRGIEDVVAVDPDRARADTAGNARAPW